MRPFFTVALLLVLLPLLAQPLWERFHPPPNEIVLACGTFGSASHDLGQRLSRTFSEQLGLTVHLLPTSSALAPLELVHQELADLALCPDNLLVLLRSVSDEAFSNEVERGVRLLASLDWLPLLFVHERQAAVNGPDDLRGLPFCLGTANSYTRAAAASLLNRQADLLEAALPGDCTLSALGPGFDQGSLGAALVVSPLGSPLLSELTSRPGLAVSGVGRDTPWSSGFPFATCPLPGGAPDQTTRAAVLQLLTPENAHPELVERITRLLLNPTLTGQLGLDTLAREGAAFAAGHRDHVLHPGACAALGLPNACFAADRVRAHWGAVLSALMALVLTPLLVLLCRRSRRRLDEAG